MPTRTTRSRRTLAGALALLTVATLPLTTIAQSPSVPAPSAPAASGAPSGPVTVIDASGAEVVIEDSSRIVTLGGVVTEIAYALGAGDRIVAVDASSFYPPEAQAEKLVLPYYRMLTAEPVLAAEPTLVLGTAEVGPAEVVAQITDAGVTTLLLPVDNSVDGALARITSIGTALGLDAEAAALAEQLQADLADAATTVAGAASTPTVMFLLLPPGAPLLASGTGSEADTMITLAGGQNAMTSFPGYIPLTPESAAAAAPDIILTTTSSLQAAGGIEGLLAYPGIAETPAGQSGTIVDMDDLYLLGFGPRTGKAVADLARLLHPELAK